MSKPPLPPQFVNRMKSQLGEEVYPLFERSIENLPITSIRINPFKSFELPDKIKSIPWDNHGYYLDQRPSFVKDPLWHAGVYYVQESSSMFISHLLESIQAPKDGVFLDLAAAPGGKSTLLSSFLGESGFLVANEVIQARANILKENIIKWGLGNTLVTNNDPEHFKELHGFFDVVLVDAPCSGEGLFRRDPQAREEWSQENVQLCSARQQRIMDIAGELVKGGGYLIYSTCTFNEQENEEMIKFIASEFSYEPVQIPLQEEWNIVESQIATEEGTFYGYRFYPHHVQGEGFFVSVLKRSEESEVANPSKSKEFKHPYLKLANKIQREFLQQQIEGLDEKEFYQLQESVFVINKQFKNHFEYLTRYLNIKYFGVELGKMNNDQWIPSHEFAMSTLPKNKCIQAELNLEQSLQYLSKDDFSLESSGEGWLLVTYQQVVLGWLKILKNRINNYYPKEWRIRVKT
jgi:16S rRNA C967 or C1407 C5-methylase (RsmB/RsmF family)/NOL1/NOP2/fmu family ribosome biogenesis protein